MLTVFRLTFICNAWLYTGQCFIIIIATTKHILIHLIGVSPKACSTGPFGGNEGGYFSDQHLGELHTIDGVHVWTGDRLYG